MSLPIEQIANYGLAGLAIALFYMFAKDAVQKQIDALNSAVKQELQVIEQALTVVGMSLDNNTDALNQIRIVIEKCKKVEV